MKKILTIGLIAFASVVASCTKKLELKNTLLSDYRFSFSPKNILGTAD